MRFRCRRPKHPELGCDITTKVFLLFPRRIDDEWVWLEKVYKIETYVKSIYYHLFFGAYSENEWITSYAKIPKTKLRTGELNV